MTSPYFVWEPWSAGAGWRPLAELCDADIVAERVQIARQALAALASLDAADLPERVVASVTFLGWAARLLSPPLGQVVAAGVLPLAELTQCWWRPVPGGPLPLAVNDLEFVSVADLSAEQIAPLFIAATITGLIEPMLEVFRHRFRLSPKVLWGNVASALAGAASVLADADADADADTHEASRRDCCGLCGLPAAGRHRRANSARSDPIAPIPRSQQLLPVLPDTRRWHVR